MTSIIDAAINAIYDNNNGHVSPNFKEAPLVETDTNGLHCNINFLTGEPFFIDSIIEQLSEEFPNKTFDYKYNSEYKIDPYYSKIDFSIIIH